MCRGLHANKSTIDINLVGEKKRTLGKFTSDSRGLHSVFERKKIISINIHTKKY